MPELFDTSRIPDSPEHWDALSTRVAAEAMRNARSNGFDWFVQSPAGWLAASLLLAAGVAYMTVAAGSAADDTPPALTDALSPGDFVGTAMVSRDKPPEIGALLIREAGGVR